MLHPVLMLVHISALANNFSICTQYYTALHCTERQGRVPREWLRNLPCILRNLELLEFLFIKATSMSLSQTVVKGLYCLLSILNNHSVSSAIWNMCITSKHLVLKPKLAFLSCIMVYVLLILSYILYVYNYPWFGLIRLIRRQRLEGEH